MFINFLLKAASTGVTLELQHLLDRFRQLNGDEKYNELVAALKNSFTLLQDVTDKTATKVDDTLVKIVLDSLPDVLDLEGEKGNEGFTASNFPGITEEKQEEPKVWPSSLD